MPSTKPPKSAAILIVSLRWNGEIIATRAVRPGETVTLGDAEGALAPLPETALGAPSIAVGDTDGGPHLRVPAGKVASIAEGSGALRLVAGPAREALVPGEEARMLFGTFQITLSAELEEKAPRRRRIGTGAWLHTAVVAAVHAMLLAAGARAALASSLTDDGAEDIDRMRGYLAAAEQRSSTPDKILSDDGGQHDTKRTTGRSGNGKDAGGERHSGEAGKAGSSTSRFKDRHFGATPAPEKGTASPAETVMDGARDFGMVGLLKSAEAGPGWRMDGTSPWGSTDPFAGAGGLLGRVVGDSAGTTGLSLSGTGEGGGGRGDGIGLGVIGTIGHADGLPGLGTGGTGTAAGGVGFGFSHSRWGHEHRTRAPRFWGDFTSVSGRLPPEVVQRTIRANFGRFRTCYEQGLLHNPQLAGRVTTQFVIGRDGSVASVSDGGTDLPDNTVSQCVRRAFYNLSFPQPEGGIVTVVYPIVFSHD